MKDTLDDINKLISTFSSHNIPTSDIAFYNHPNFVQAEKIDSGFLELYAAYVRLRTRNNQYEQYVRKIVPIVAQKLANEIAIDGQLGICIDISQILSKMLEELGIWCYPIKGALSITSDLIDPSTHFYLFEDKPVAGHAWVVAPPYEIIDVVLQAQQYTRNESAHLPLFLLSEGAQPIVPVAEDLIGPTLLQKYHQQFGGTIDDLHLRVKPGMVRALNSFPSWSVQKDAVTLQYSTGGVYIPEAPNLEAIQNITLNGRDGKRILEELIRPNLK